MLATDVVLWLQGGLGNQLFQLNALLEARERLRCAASVSAVNYLRDAKRDFEIGRLLGDVRVRPNAVSVLIDRPYSRNGALRTRTAISRRPIAASLSDVVPGAMLVGFFQDQRSIEHGTGRILDRLSVVKLSPSGAAVAARVANRVVAHVRRGDYATLASAKRTFGELTLNYYSAAATSIGADLRDLVFFTDDRSFVKHAFGVPDEQIVSGTDIASPLETVLAMGSARSIVIPNSSFSWWASELVAARGGAVAAPQKWFLDRPDRLGPARTHWIRIENQ